jgi:serine/threonine-protein kinase HipA
MTSALVVSIGGVRAGLLHRRHEGSFFELGEEYLELAYRPVLGQLFEDDPKRPHRTRHGVPTWFANLLPEGPLRHLIAERANVDESRSFFLLSVLGDDLPGAVAVHGLDDEALENGGPPSREEAAKAPLRFSLAGVQLKFSAIREERGLTIPAAGLGGDWIVKLPDQRFDRVPENEFSMMELARRCGLEVPETELVNVGEIEGLPSEVAEIDGRALAVRRFDRTEAGRVHIEDFAQVLDLSPAKKYGATNFDTIARVVASTCGGEDTDELLRRLVFMVAIGNSDAHAKNWSLIYPDGRSPRLAPAYDLVAVSLYEAADPMLDRRLALKLAGVTAAEDVGESTFRRFAQRVGLDEERTVSVVRGEVQTIREAWEAFRQISPDATLSASLVAVIDERLERLPLFRRLGST